MKKSTLHIATIILLVSFTLTVVGLNVHYHFCGFNGDVSVGLTEVSCSCDHEDFSPSSESCCSDAQACGIDNQCCQETSEYISISSDFIFQKSENKLKSIELASIYHSNNEKLSFSEKIESKLKLYIKKTKEIPKKIIINILKKIISKKEPDSNNIL